jgi:hypothetical protein
VTLSEQQIVDCDSLEEGCGGGDFTSVVKYVHKNGGIDSDADYPYLGREDTCQNPKAKRNHVVTVDGYQHVPMHNETALMQSVAYTVSGWVGGWVRGCWGAGLSVCVLSRADVGSAFLHVARAWIQGAGRWRAGLTQLC